MSSFRWVAAGAPSAWVAATLLLYWISGRTAPVAEPAPTPEPPREYADEAAIERLADLLFPPPLVRAGGPVGRESGIDARALADWMTEVEASRPAGRLAALYDIVDRHYDGVAGEGPPLIEDGLPGPAWRDILDDWRNWARRHEWKHRLVVALEEVWLPGPPAGHFVLAVDDGLGRIAALFDERCRPRSADPVAGWTRHRFDGSAEREARPPLRTTGVSLVLVPGGDLASGPVRIPLDAEVRAGAVPLWHAREDRVVGLAVLRWEWSP